MTGAPKIGGEGNPAEKSLEEVRAKFEIDVATFKDYRIYWFIRGSMDPQTSKQLEAMLPGGLGLVVREALKRKLFVAHSDEMVKDESKAVKKTGDAFPKVDFSMISDSKLLHQLETVSQDDSVLGRHALRLAVAEAIRRNMLPKPDAQAEEGTVK